MIKAILLLIGFVIVYTSTFAYFFHNICKAFGHHFQWYECFVLGVEILIVARMIYTYATFCIH